MFCSTATQREVANCRFIKFRKVRVVASTFTVTGIMSCFRRRTVISAFGLSALIPFLLHLLRRRVVDVGLALRKQLFSKLHYGGEMVAGVGELVWMDLEHGNIFQNHLGTNIDM